MKVELNPHLKSLSDKAVLSFDNSHISYKLKVLYEKLLDLFQQESWYERNNFNDYALDLLKQKDIRMTDEIFDEGLPCEILDASQFQYQKGKLVAKLVLEFIPDEPESPLDEIRRDMEKYNS
ncbi:MAG: KGK domain-containing protein [Cyanobacteriota bacterium]